LKRKGVFLLWHFYSNVDFSLPRYKRYSRSCRDLETKKLKMPVVHLLAMCIPTFVTVCTVNTPAVKIEQDSMLPDVLRTLNSEDTMHQVVNGNDLSHRVFAINNATSFNHEWLGNFRAHPLVQRTYPPSLSARTGSPNAHRVVEMVGGSNTTATSFILPPHFSHLRTSILKVRLRSCAQGMQFLIRDFCFLSEVPADGGCSRYCIRRSGKTTYFCDPVRMNQLSEECMVTSSTGNFEARNVNVTWVTAFDFYGCGEGIRMVERKLESKPCQQSPRG
jgi:hypothetical protein